LGASHSPCLWIQPSPPPLLLVQRTWSTPSVSGLDLDLPYWAPVVSEDVHLHRLPCSIGHSRAGASPYPSASPRFAFNTHLLPAALGQPDVDFDGNYLQQWHLSQQVGSGWGGYSGKEEILFSHSSISHPNLCHPPWCFTYRL
jgi:hypothetical protein